MGRALPRGDETAITFNLADEAGGKMALKFDYMENLITGSEIGDPRGDQVCYLPFFGSGDGQESVNQSLWYVGTILMKDYYIVLDATPSTE